MKSLFYGGLCTGLLLGQDHMVGTSCPAISGDSRKLLLPTKTRYNMLINELYMNWKPG